jgi:hypothetical protein
MEHILSNWFVSVWCLTDKCDNRCRVCDAVDGDAVVICVPEVLTGTIVLFCEDKAFCTGS